MRTNEKQLLLNKAISKQLFLNTHFSVIFGENNWSFNWNTTLLKKFKHALGSIKTTNGTFYQIP